MKNNNNYISIFVLITAVIFLSACATGKGGGSQKYIFYMHGSVEEGEGSTEKYEMAVDAINQGSAKVISEVRGDTNPVEYADKIKAQVAALIKKGVSPKSITIAGYSKGAIIALAASAAIKNPEISYVLLAGCSAFLNDKYSVDANRAVGRILSIYDLEDEKFGSCSSMLGKANNVEFNEVELDSGKGHKLFRIPKEKFIEQWRDPLLNWAGA